LALFLSGVVLLSRNLELEICNDPFRIVLQAFEELYPDKFAYIQYDHTLDYDKNEFGYTEFPENGDGYPLVGINPKLSVQDAVEVLAHELAHVAAGYSSGHGAEWEEAFDKIHHKYNEIFSELFK